jgi:hypothetical protein
MGRDARLLELAFELEAAQPFRTIARSEPARTE